MKKNNVEFMSAKSSVCWPTVFSFRICAWCQLVSPTSFSQPVWRLWVIHSLWLSFRLGCSRLFCPAGFLSAQGPGRGGSPNVWQYCMYHLHLPLEGASGIISNVGSLGHPPGGTSVQSSGKLVGVFPCPCATRLVLSHIISSNVQFLRIRRLFHVRGQSM